MRHLLIGLLLSGIIVACSSSSDPIDELFVDELTPAEQADLCEEFLDLYCNSPGGDGFCDDPCIDTGCTPAAENGEFDIECTDALEGEVLDCGASGDDIDCPIGGGGCMIDALEAACA